MRKLFAVAVTAALAVPGPLATSAAAQYRAASIPAASLGTGANAAASVSAVHAPISFSAPALGAAPIFAAPSAAQPALAPALSPVAAAAPLAAASPIEAVAAKAAPIAAAPAGAQGQVELARPIAAVGNAAALSHFAAPASGRDASLDGRNIRALYGESDGSGMVSGFETAPDEGGRAASLSHLSAASAATAAPSPAPAAKPAATIADFAGTWNKVSGHGYDQVKVATSKDGVSVTEARYGVHEFRGINGPAVQDQPWRGNVLAPGGLVTRETTTRFENGKLEEVSVRVEKPMLAWANALVERTSLALEDGRLVLRTESTLYRRTFFYFGPFNVRTSINLTNLASPERAPEAVVYERAGAPALTSAAAPAAAPSVRVPAATGKALIRTAVGAAVLAASTPLLAATPGAASAHPVLRVGASAVIGAVAGFAAVGGGYHYRHRNEPHGDFDFSILGDLFFGAIGAVVGGIVGAVIGAAI